MKYITILVQAAVLNVIYLIGTWLTAALHLPLPGSIVGMVLLFLLLHFNIVKLEWIERGAGLLLAELVLFFIPPVVGVVSYKEMLGSSFVRLAAVILLSTFTVMACTALTAQFSAKRKGRENDESMVRSR
ncbi:CidA/LrgA family holin-like protein [Halobacillus salinarum]|uniref:CidA/LrgA family holin-like protein n=1 Tax=Halobacillus salinarum TaxID=2932257 RepID=A0ABY4ELE5_9BACI|nr:CidA/LrgA family holin-like protein [Halobacillus salinarum]UOQ44938.1 CidA/LrgA family holin-like protein [Halobacillus salinarum]